MLMGSLGRVMDDHEAEGMLHGKIRIAPWFTYVDGWSRVVELDENGDGEVSKLEFMSWMAASVLICEATHL